MQRSIKNIGLINLLVLLLAGVTAFAVARYSGTLAGQAACAFIGIGFLVAAISYFQMRLEESERLEKLEFEELRKGKDSSLFASTDADIFPAQRAREHFERFLVPAFTVLLFLLEAAGAYFGWRWLGGARVVDVAHPTVALALFSVFFIVLFLLGKYSTHLARLERHSLLRAGASYLVFAAYLCAAVVVCVTFVWGGYARVDLYAAKAFAVLLGLMALETAVGLLLEIYRPRVKGRRERVLYESRVVGLLAHPEGLVSTAAQALDYQFGFKVSETWFYRFLQRALAWIILVQFAVLVLSTSIVFIEPGEQGLLERFGKPLTGRNPLNPGVHFKFPWPIDKVHRAHTEKIQGFFVGIIPDENNREKTVVWTLSHYKEEFNLLVASPQERMIGGTNAPVEQGVPADLITVSIPVQYQISDLDAWTYNHSDAAQMVQDLASREVVRYLVGVDLFDIMSRGREGAGDDLRQRIQAQADALKLGVRILFVGLQDIHPPVKVAPAFEEVIGAIQSREALVHEAEGYAYRTVDMARAQAEQIVNQAEAYYAERVSAAQASAGQFTNQVVAFNAAPQVYMQRAYLDALERGATNARKYVLAVTNAQDVIMLNLEEKISQDLFDITLPGEK